MADFNQFGSAKPPQPGNPHDCARCEAMLADALDGTLSAADQATFELHMAACPGCAAMLNDARRGLAWMETLKSAQPEPPATLLDRIFAETSSKAAQPGLAADHRRAPNALLGRPMPAPAHGVDIQPAAAFSTTNVLPFRARFAQGLRSLGQTMLQPRLAMTAAMAFFSIALTMNLTGIRLSSLRASDFKPSSILRACYNTKARVVRYSDNLRVVYELESRVRELQRSDNDFSPTPAPQNAPAATSPQTPSGDKQQPDSQKPGSQNPDQKQTRPKPGPGSSRRETPGGNLLRVGSIYRRGTQLASLQPFVVFLPSVVLPSIKDEGGLA